MGKRKRHNKSLGMNAIMSGLDMFLTTLFPMITFPYVSRVLGVENIGRYNFSRSISQYCLLISMLGVNTYAIREGAKYKKHRTEIGIFASQLFSINLMMCAISYTILGVWLSMSTKLKENGTCILILSTTSLFTAIGVNWIYQIYEEYTYITIRNFAVKLISLLMILLFVRNKEDYVIYVLIMAFSTACVGIINYIYSRKFCQIGITKSFGWRIHFKPLIILASSNLATYIYASSDITMLGFWTNNYYVGIYATVEKFYNLSKSVLLALLTVTVPRLAYYVGQKEEEQFKNLIKKVIDAMNTLMFPLMAIVFVMSDDIIMILGGKEFDEASITLKILSFAIIFSMYAWIASTCILVPYKMERHTLIATILGAILNVFLNVLLLPRYQANAAAFTTVLAELCVAAYCSFHAKKLIAFRYFNKNTIYSLFASFVILFISNIIKEVQLNSVFRLSITGIIGLLLYFLILHFLNHLFICKSD